MSKRGLTAAQLLRLLNSDAPTDLHTALRKAVEATGQPIAAIARKAGIAQPMLYRFMTGERDITLRTADKLAACLDLELRPRSKPRKQGS